MAGKYLVFGVGISVACLSGQSVAADGFLDGLESMVTNGSASLDFRYRYEQVDQDGFDKDAKASTLRSRLTLTSGSIGGFSALLEFDDVTAIGPDDYNSTTNGKVEFPIVADPEGTDFNQGWIQYAAGDSKGTLGRQRILHGNQRFVGGVAWRQNEQTYDSLRGQFKLCDSFDLDLAYVDQINRPFGPDDGAQPAEWEGDSFFARADYALGENHTLAGFGYLIDVDPITGYAGARAQDNSTTTFGVEYSGKLGPMNLMASYATQSDSGDSDLDYRTDYLLLEGGTTFGIIGLKVGYEVLAADDGVGFKTPLATLHKFQGFADKFLDTPADGLEDIYVSLNGALGPVKLAAIYHDFTAEDSSEDLGSELDLVATWPIDKRFSLQAKFASFDSDNKARFDDTDKFWIIAQLKL